MFITFVTSFIVEPITFSEENDCNISLKYSVLQDRGHVNFISSICSTTVRN